MLPVPALRRRCREHIVELKSGLSWHLFEKIIFEAIVLEERMKDFSPSFLKYGLRLPGALAIFFKGIFEINNLRNCSKSDLPVFFSI